MKKPKVSMALQPPSEDELALIQARLILKRLANIQPGYTDAAKLRRLTKLPAQAVKFFKRFGK